MFSEIITEVMTEAEPAGLDFWMGCVLTECNRVRQNPDPASIHGLRVALRRCRSIADGFMTLDPHPVWKMMKTESRRLFQQFGSLRDTQVMIEWVRRLMPVPDETSFILQSFLRDQEDRYKESAAQAVLDLNQKRWASWTRILSARARQVPAESIVFQHLALERLLETHNLHQQAIRNRSHASYHRLRIGLKKFRYTVENFLPSRHAHWGADLRSLQDILGEMHDLDVLWRTAIEIQAMHCEKARREWHQRIKEEITARIEDYRAKMLGKTSLFSLWRSELPDPGQIYVAGLARLRTWASFRDPDIPHSEHVAKLALQIYDGLESLGLIASGDLPDARQLLQSAALIHAAGSGEGSKKQHVRSYRLIRKLDPPLGLTTDILRHIALIVRFHRGSLPSPGQKAWAGIPESHRKILVMLSGILRLADAFDRLHRKRIYRVELRQLGDVLCITAPGYDESNQSALKLASARHLLEMTCRLPILIKD